MVNGNELVTKKDLDETLIGFFQVNIKRGTADV